MLLFPESGTKKDFTKNHVGKELDFQVAASLKP